MTRAVGNGLIKTLADAIGTGAVGKLAKQVAGLSTDMANIKTPDKGSGLMFNPDTGKLYIPCGNGVTVNKNTGMLEVPNGDNLRYTGSGLDVPDADETTAGVVKLTHEVSNRNDGERAITADGVYAYTLGYSAPSSAITPVIKAKGGVTYCRAIPGLLICEFFVNENVALDSVILEIAGYAADVSRVFDIKYFTFENTATSIHVKSLGTLEPADYRFIVPAHKI